MTNRILKEGHNCWKLAKADKVAFLVDGEESFKAIHEALLLAKENIFIVGWDIHSELVLIRDKSYETEYPVKLGDLLAAIGKKRPEINIYILEWDFAMIYAMERELFPNFKLYWKTKDRVNFCLDGEHPIGASQHQKVIVIDDSLAFSGGLDLTRCRWDTTKHLPNDERRVDPEKQSYPPFHDLHCVVSGEAARWLGVLTRDRWQRAGNPAVPEPKTEQKFSHWPASVAPALTEVNVAIARTFPPYKDAKEVKEVEQLYLDSIAAAKEYIYIENQYLSSHSIGKALKESLTREKGPEIVIVLPEKISGWLEHHTMDVLRARLLQDLIEADKHDRLQLFYVRIAQKPHLTLMVHGKVMIVDDRFLRLASSNLSNRSMGLDSECDIALESTENKSCNEQIRHFRNRLLAEHLSVSIDELEQELNEKQSLTEAIEALSGNERTLLPLNDKLPDDLDLYVPESQLLDPEKPVEPEEFFNHVFNSNNEPKAYRYWLKSGILLTFIIILLAIWHFSPAADWLNIENLTRIGNTLNDMPMTPLLVFAIYIIAGLLAMPITLLIAATLIVFGVWLGSLYALVGAEISALTTFALGRLLGKQQINNLIGSKYNRVWRTIGNRGLLTIITLRIVPIAPFSVINVGAGVSAIKLKDFALGNLIGLLPGVISSAFIVESFTLSIKEPGTATFIVLLLAITITIPALFWLKAWIKRKSSILDQENTSE